ncbi:cysteine hydrolase family protein [Agrobacterium sp. NPDC090283]|uniref:cysteine hydrolase family protein n=1 Tax=Agrobacterium sp. NPDC090283 TaxID=3363920 RepID=UPI00383B817F
MSSNALIVVDLQNEYLPDGKLALVGIEAAVSNAAAVIAWAREQGHSIIFIRHVSPDPAAPFFTAGTPAIEIIEAVSPLDGDLVIEKHFPNSFRETSLKQILEEKGVRDLTIVGAMSHICIDATTRAAVDFGYTTTLVHDACATRDMEFEGRTVPASFVHDAFMSALNFAYAKVTKTEDLVK